MKPTILLVDDDDHLRQLIRRALGEAYHVIEAPGGYEALTQIMLGKQPVGLIVTDLNMPDLGGVEFVENLPREIPLIVISAYLETPEFQGALEHLRPRAIFKKPFSLADLRLAVQRVLGQDT